MSAIQQKYQNNISYLQSVMKKGLLFIFIILISSSDCISQTSIKSGVYPEISIGNFKGKYLHVDSFKALNYIKISGGMLVKSVDMFFSGANFQQAIAVSLGGASLSGFSLAALKNVVDKCIAGTVITVERIIVQTEKRQTNYYIGKSFILYSGNDSSSSQKVIKETTKQLYELMKKEFISGKVYFSGSGFSNIITVTKKDFPSLSNLFARCAPGSVITFENCIYKEPGGTLSKPLFKSIKFE